jgi:hypothetical protein
MHFHIELMDGPVPGCCNAEHDTDSGGFDDRTEGLAIVDTGLLSEPTKYPSAGKGTRDQVSFRIRALNSSNIASCQWGSLRAAR